jgi:hypothetical protein
LIRFARQAPQSMAVVLRGNPEYAAPEALEDIADRALDELVRRVTTGQGHFGDLI